MGLVALALFGSAVAAVLDPATGEVFSLGIGDSPPLPDEARNVYTSIVGRSPTTWHLVFPADLVTLRGGEKCLLNRGEFLHQTSTETVTAVLKGTRCLQLSGADQHNTLDSSYMYILWALLAGLAAVASSVSLLLASTLKTSRLRLTLAVAGGILALVTLLCAGYA